jgi:exopolysaccharide biosynthesis polyprenyl glycosylphosphotransferase
VPWLGEHDEAAAAVSRSGATGAIVVASAFEPTALNRTLRQLLGSGCHVHLSSGVRGISHERLLPLPLAREPLFYLERTSLTRSQLAIKRVVDLVVGAVMLVVLLPVLVVAAAAVKLHDGGEVLFRQRRIGHRGREFTLYKLRTMVSDAESRRADLERLNLREGGPLFKLARDPRVTPVGRLLRITSIDELPQLINVLRGDMSLIGPRPALPWEVAQFDDELRQRGRMMPGITGLWQVEARDDPSFDTYRRLDLYYIENWSIGLDLAILFATAGVVVSRALKMFLSSSAPPA